MGLFGSIRPTPLDMTRMYAEGFGALVKRFVKPIASRVFQFLVYSIYVPIPSIVLHTLKETFFPQRIIILYWRRQGLWSLLPPILYALVMEVLGPNPISIGSPGIGTHRKVTGSSQTHICQIWDQSSFQGYKNPKNSVA